MTWIKTISPEDDEKVRRAMDAQREFYPIEYAVPFIRLRMVKVPVLSLRTARSLKHCIMRSRPSVF